MTEFSHPPATEANVQNPPVDRGNSIGGVWGTNVTDGDRRDVADRSPTAEHDLSPTHSLLPFRNATHTQPKPEESSGSMAGGFEARSLRDARTSTTG
jgi:hypothetical protein